MDLIEIVLAAIDDGFAPWRKPWAVRRAPNRPLGRTRPYGSLNRMILGCSPFACPLWVTADRAAARGWTPRADERPWPLLTWLRPPMPGTQAARAPGAATGCAWRVLDIFNLEQLEGPRWVRPASLVSESDRLAEAEAWLAALPERPRIERSSRAAYAPTADIVMMPPMWQFDSPADYYSTLFHEVIHWTGAPHRLNRWSKAAPHRGDDAYAYEELVAELGAQFLCDAFGLQNRTLENSVAYLAGWAKALKDHPAWLSRACVDAERAVAWTLSGAPAQTLRGALSASLMTTSSLMRSSGMPG
jgi:antirestriction protein ArdC